MFSHVGIVFLKQFSESVISSVLICAVFPFSQIGSEMTLDEALVITSALQRGAATELDH